MERKNAVCNGHEVKAYEFNQQTTDRLASLKQSSDYSKSGIYNVLVDMYFAEVAENVKQTQAFPLRHWEFTVYFITSRVDGVNFAESLTIRGTEIAR